MKICICCSLSFTKEVLQIAQQLETLGHEVPLPNGVINHLAEQPNYDPIQTKIETDPVHLHTDKIRTADAVWPNILINPSLLSFLCQISHLFMMKSMLLNQKSLMKI